MAQHEQSKSTKPSQGAATRIPGWKTGMFHFAALPLGRSARRTTHHTITKSWHKHHKPVLKTWLKQNLRQVSGVDVPLSVSKQRPTSHSLHHQGSARAHSVSPVVQSMCVFLEKKATLSGEGIIKLLLYRTCICFTAWQQDKCSLMELFFAPPTLMELLQVTQILLCWVLILVSSQGEIFHLELAILCCQQFLNL